MTVRSQPHRISWPLNAEQVDNIDQMFQILFDDTRNGRLTIQLDQVVGGFPLSVPNGGTGITVYATGDLLYASATTTLSRLNIGAAGKVLRSTGSLPAWSTFTIPDTYTQGDIIYASASNTLTALAKDTNATRYLSNTGTSNNPAWAQVNLSNGTTGTIGATQGGTGQTAVATGDLLYGSATDTWSRLAAGLAGRYLRGGGAGTAPAWSNLILPNVITNGAIPYADATDQLGGSLTPTQGSIIYGSSSTLWSKLAKDTNATRYLANTGTSNNPQWDQVNLTNGVTGDLPFSSFVQASAASKLVGRGSAAGAGDFQEISLGSGMSMSGTTLSSTGGSGDFLVIQVFS